MSENEGIDITEAVDVSVTEDGSLVTDDVTIASDEASGDALVDEIMTVEAPDGSIAGEEIITAVSGKDGSEEVLSDVIGAADADGNAFVADITED